LVLPHLIAERRHKAVRFMVSIGNDDDPLHFGLGTKHSRRCNQYRASAREQMSSIEHDSISFNAAARAGNLPPPTASFSCLLRRDRQGICFRHIAPEVVSCRRIGFAASARELQ
jgi:hypothetical protein